MQLNPPVEIVELLARKKTAIDINEGFSVALGNEFEFACIATCPQEIGDGRQPIGGQFQVEFGVPRSSACPVSLSDPSFSRSTYSSNN